MDDMVDDVMPSLHDESDACKQTRTDAELAIKDLEHQLTTIKSDGEKCKKAAAALLERHQFLKEIIPYVLEYDYDMYDC